MGLFNFLTQDIAIDLGTANILIMHNNALVLDEPAIIAFNRTTQEVLAVGHKAQQMEGKTHENIRTIRPLMDGVIADFNAAEHLIRGLIKMIQLDQGWFTPSLRMVICIPAGITEVEKRAIRDSAQTAGAKEVYLIQEPMAAALGIGIDVEEPVGNMIIDIGGGTTEIAVIAMSGIVCDQSIKVAGQTFDAEILQYMRQQHNLMIGLRTAEKIKIEVGAAAVDLEFPPKDYAVLGRDLMSGIPKKIKVSYVEIAHCLDKTVAKMEEAVMKALEITPPELASDIYQNGIYLTGGGALLRGLDRRIAAITKLPVHVPEDALRAVSRGTGIALQNLDRFTFLMR
ncbi:rod shape-determining protein [Adhaeribacter radiodurans]|uniref:Cell shape-determining protein MreB n=1 Tax=Adhaeribacter radiodurans TaxID=2745197 RepID=A0A7L7LB23_9BACT|nr:rod shape-determining protein [Adhaeribacter radiodurans]QMU29755.1 rod shape-determining protein [Adhaeribacter radiodurans]